MFYTRQSISDKFLFFQYPKVLLYGEHYRGKLKPAERELYILLLDRTKLSIKNDWFDEKDRAFCIYGNQALKEILGISEPTLIKFKKRLEALDLLKEESVEGYANRIYIKQLQITKNDLMYIRELEETEDEILQEDDPLKNLSTPLKKFKPSKKEYINTRNSGSELDNIVENNLPSDMYSDIIEEEEKPKIKQYSIQEIQVFNERLTLHYLAYYPKTKIDSAIKKIQGKYLNGQVIDYPSLLNHELNKQAEAFATKRAKEFVKDSSVKKEDRYTGSIPHYNWLEQ